MRGPVRRRARGREGTFESAPDERKGAAETCARRTRVEGVAARSRRVVALYLSHADVDAIRPRPAPKSILSESARRAIARRHSGALRPRVAPRVAMGRKKQTARKSTKGVIPRRSSPASPVGDQEMTTAESERSSPASSVGDQETTADLGAAVADAVLAKYASLPKHGKPQAGEYTLLAGFALTDDATPNARPVVVALGTGTKCVGASARCPRGRALADSHAEVIARRALRYYLLAELYAEFKSTRGTPVSAQAPQPSAFPIFERIGTGRACVCVDCGGRARADPGGCERYRLRPGVRLHMYTTQSPCGDASVFPRSDEDACEGHGCGGGDEGEDDDGGDGDETRTKKRAKTTGGGVTGAKLLGGGGGGVDAEYGATDQAVGRARVKPGRGDQTNCMSCSDKIAKWVALGVQGSALSELLVEPVFLYSITVASRDGDSSRAALRRAVVDRTQLLGVRVRPPPPWLWPPTPPLLHLSPPPPIELRGDARTTEPRTACGFSINYVAVRPDLADIFEDWKFPAATAASKGSVEVTMGAVGFKAGFNKKGRDSDKAMSRLCRYRLACLAIMVMREVRWRIGVRLSSYAALRAAAAGYNDARAAFASRPSPFERWTTKEPCDFNMAILMPIVPAGLATKVVYKTT